MSLAIGRCTLTTPQDVDYQTRNPGEPGIAGPFTEDAYALRGREAGAGAAAAMVALALEARRFEAVYCSESNAIFPSGYYRVDQGAGYRVPRGAPTRKPWNFALVRKERPVIVRHAYSDNVAGADTADVDADEALKTVYTAAAGEVLVVDPRNVAGAEPLNLPAGDWKLLARVQSRTTVTQKFRAKLTDLAGAAIATGAQVTVGAGNQSAWTLLDLGTLMVPTANDKANWLTLSVQANVDLNDVWIDYIRLVPA